MSTQFIHPSAHIDPAARLSENTTVGPEAQIGPQVINIHRATIGAYTRIFGVVSIGYGVRIGARVTLIGPLTIEEDVVIGDDVTIGVVLAAGSQLEQTIIRKGVHILAKTQVLGRLFLGEYACLGPGARLEGDVPHHGLAKGSPAALCGFICTCGREYNLSRVFGELRILECPACHAEYRVGVPDFMRQGKFLLPNQGMGEPIPPWFQTE